MHNFNTLYTVLQDCTNLFLTTLQNITQRHNPIHNFTKQTLFRDFTNNTKLDKTLHHFYKTWQIFSNLHKNQTKLYNALHNVIKHSFANLAKSSQNKKTTQNKSKLNKNQQHFAEQNTTFYTSLQNFTSTVTKLIKTSQKLYTITKLYNKNYTQLYNTLHHSTQLRKIHNLQKQTYTTLPNSTQLLRHFTTLHNTLHNFAQLVTNKDFTKLYKTLQNFTTLYTSLHNFTKRYKT